MKLFQLILLLFLSTTKQLLADSPAPVFPHEMTSENSKYILSSVPYHIFGAFGKSYVIDVKSKDTIYVLDQYLKQPVLIDNSGKYIVQINSWPAKDVIQEIDAVTIYKNGIKTKSIRLSELITDTTKLLYSVSHIMWYNVFKIRDQKIIIKTRSQDLLTFDLKTGAKANNLSNQKSIDKESFVKPRIKLNDSIKYPNDTRFPTLSNGKDIYTSFNSETFGFRIFSDEEISSIKVPTKAFYLIILIDQSGKGRLEKFYIEDVNHYQRLFGAKQEKEISEFINSVTFDSSLIPPEIGNWAFASWIYIEEKE